MWNLYSVPNCVTGCNLARSSLAAMLASPLCVLLRRKLKVCHQMRKVTVVVGVVTTNGIKMAAAIKRESITLLWGLNTGRQCSGHVRQPPGQSSIVPERNNDLSDTGPVTSARDGTCVEQVHAEGAVT